MKVPVRIKKSTDLARRENLSSSLAGPLKTLTEINGSVVAARVPTRPPKALSLELHGFPETLGFLGKLNDSASVVKGAQELVI